MYKTQGETRAFFAAFLPLVGDAAQCDVVIAPPFTSIAAAVESAKGSRVAIAGQNNHWQKEGAFTGEVSPQMLVEVGCTYVIVGHSERRQYCHETDDMISQKSRAALAAGLTPIVCLGENFTERETSKTEEILSQQFIGGPGALTAQEFSRILLAYEPVWAIGTGRTATPEIAAAAHRFLRQCVRDQFAPEVADRVPIVYGGSVKPDNIQGLMAQKELDGALVGGASLDPKSFAAIVSCS